MDSERWMWIYLNRFGWFYTEGDEEVEWEQAQAAYDTGKVVLYRAPDRRAEPRRLGDDRTLEDVEQECREHEPLWAPRT